MPRRKPMLRYAEPWQTASGSKCSSFLAARTQFRVSFPRPARQRQKAYIYICDMSSKGSLMLWNHSKTNEPYILACMPEVAGCVPCYTWLLRRHCWASC